MGGRRCQIGSLEAFKERIRERMAERGMRFDIEVARASGMKASTYANIWKDGRKDLPYADQAVVIARALGTTVEYLVTGEGFPTVEKPDPDLVELCRRLHGAPKEIVAAALTILGKENSSGRGRGGSTEEAAG